MAQNSRRSRENLRKGRPFAKGVSGNPGGRPKGLAEAVRKVCGPDAEKLITLFAAVAFADAEWLAAHDFEVPSNRERLEAATWLGERGWGKAPQSVEIAGSGGGPVKVEVVFVGAGRSD